MIGLTGDVSTVRVDQLLDVSSAEIRNKKLLSDLATDPRSGKVAVPALEAVLIHDNISGKNTAGTGQSYGHIDNKYPFVFPTLTTAERDAIPAPTTSMKIYNSDTAQFEKWGGAAWVVDGTGVINLYIFDATVGAGGDYATIEAALNAGKKNIKLLSNVTMLANGPIITEGILIYGDAIGVTINCNGFQFRQNNVYSRYRFENLTLTTSTNSPFSSTCRFIFDRCRINSYTTGFWDGIGEFRNSYIDLYAALFSGGFETAHKCTFELRQNSYLAGIYTSCTFTGAYIIYNGKFTNCTFTSITTLYQPALVDHCTNPTVDVNLASVDGKLINSEFDQLIATGSTGFCRIISCEFNGTAVINGNEHEINMNKFLSSVSFTGDSHNFSSNQVIGLLTINAGSEYNIISENKLTGGLIDSSGNTTNIIKDNI